MAGRTEQTTTYRRDTKGNLIADTEGKDYDAKGEIAAQEASDRARKAMTAGAKPVISLEEPEKGTIAHMAWERRRKAKAAGQSKALSGD
jgi:hypothetical protein